MSAGVNHSLKVEVERALTRGAVLCDRHPDERVTSCLVSDAPAYRCQRCEPKSLGEEGGWQEVSQVVVDR